MQPHHSTPTTTVAISNEERAFFVAFGERLAALRKARGHTQVQLAELLGVSQQAITAYESGQRRVPISMLPLLADTLSDATPASGARRRSCSSNSSASASYPKPASASSVKCWIHCSLSQRAERKPRFQTQ